MTATRSLDAPSATRDRGDHLALLPQNHEMVGSPITSRAQQDVHFGLQPRTDQAELTKHGFPDANQIISGTEHAAPKDAKTTTADASPREKSVSDATGVAVAADATPNPGQPGRAATTESTTDVQHNSEVVGEMPVVSTLGTDTAIVASSDTTTVGSRTTGGIDAVESRGSAVPMDRQPAQQQQHEQQNTAPLVPRADIVG